MSGTSHAAAEELVGVLSHGTVLLGLERDENIAVADAQSRVVAECQVETARGDADVIDDVSISRAG